MRKRLHVVALLVGCSCGSTATSTTTIPSAPTARTSSEPSTYSVHEWGLVRAAAGDALFVGAMGPPAPPIDLIPVEKPVLYFHLSGSEPLDIATVAVDALGGTIVEHWPYTGGGAAPASIAWTGLRLEPGSCPLRPPTAAEPPCSHVLGTRGECESLALASAVASDAACVRSATTASPLLFYRSTSTAMTAPLRAFHLDFGDIHVRNDGDHPIPGRLVRFQRSGADVRVVVVDPPAPHHTIVVGHDWGGPDVARAAVTETLRGLGLSEPEAAAFLASWDAAFFGPASATPTALEEDIPLEETPSPEESILYFLPAADVARLSRLDFEPAPTEVRRAIAVWSAF